MVLMQTTFSVVNVIQYIKSIYFSYYYYSDVFINENLINFGLVFR